ncbi:MAG: MarR family transcriptional regulator [Anaerolineae bacterium]|jgi:DNA-binding MarR family transcriptional regulator|nr:MarR family transcriptional regulator [Anaerolineae bacterium]
MVPIAEAEALDRLLGQICRLHHARAHTLLEALGLYRGQPPLLWTLAAEPGLAHSELAARLHVTPATVSKMVSRMEKVGILETRADAEDQRISRVYLTPAGMALHARAGGVAQQLGAEAFEGFGADDLGHLEGFLRQILGNLIAVQGDLACSGRDQAAKPDA